ncbi:hypothetical protein P171DRAFT_401055 [Karstenula rhodostoma CBS 690.94]|uniref:Uncharacterized protein n=1 Tax=Karstenula rhodostoma CBS 690.94 TaxID=1392251 RepID=A0A9P4UIT3_9PLEO|nr:hypothetical protein P171DRAFT_401055 [Karstenula rhodostoma CBS 690.94]
MPFCTVCSVPFNGRGSHCAHHKTYYGASDSNAINYRTRTLLHDSHRPRKPLQIGFRGSHDALVPYRPYASSNSLALAGFDPEPSHDYEGFSYKHDGDPVLSSLKPLGYAFEQLSSMHAVTQLTYSVDAHGTRSVTATANPEREQCTNCGAFFADFHRLKGHYADYPVQCDVHGVCLRLDDVLVHADEERHERCFVRGCRSVYRLEGGWKGSVVEGHVRGIHRREGIYC